MRNKNNMTAKVTFISPNIVTQKGDFFGTGIPYFPVIVAYTAAYIREKGYDVQLIDAFGEDPFHGWEDENKYIQGLAPEQIIKKIDKETILICISAERLISHNTILKIIRAIKKDECLKDIPIAILENTQAVTAYSLKKVKEEFFNEGINFIISGEPELRIEQLLSIINEYKKGHKKIIEQLKKIDGLIFKQENQIKENENKEVIENLDILPFPAWDLLKLENYWKLGYAHAPLTTNKYLPLLTSRGCPYQCTFCVVPDTNKQKWRARSAKNVVDEIEFFTNLYGVKEYHIEDLNPTINKERMKEISQEILKRNLKICWKIGSGTKVETLDEETIRWMAKAGCTYISISPESGSARIMNMMKKPFPYERALELIKEMHKNKIITQACFILGYPGEVKEDIKKTNKYIRQIVKAGIDEIAVLILTPSPGSAIFNDYINKNKLNDLTKLTFTPIWRKDYKKYAKERLCSYLLFIFWRFIYHPINTLKQQLHFLNGRFDTKILMTLYRVYKIWKISRWQKKKYSGNGKKTI